MNHARSALCCLLALLLTQAAGSGIQAQSAQPYQPVPGQPGKDVVWVPTPPALVDKMLALAQVTPKDYVIDLGSEMAAMSSAPRNSAPARLGWNTTRTWSSCRGGRRPRPASAPTRPSFKVTCSLLISRRPRCLRCF